MGYIQMDAGISELRFLVLLWAQIRKTLDEVTRGGLGLGAGGKLQRDISRQRSSSLWYSLMPSWGRGRSSRHLRILEVGWILSFSLSLSHGRVAVSGYQLRSTYVSLSLPVRKRARVYHNETVVIGWSLEPFIRESGWLGCCDRLSLR